MWHLLSFYQKFNLNITNQSRYKKRRSSHPSLPIHYFTINNCRQRTHQGRRNGQHNDPSRIHAAVLGTVADHIHRDQLQRRNIQNQKCAHFLAGGAHMIRSGRLLPILCFPPLCLQLRQFLHGFQSSPEYRPSPGPAR